MKGFAIALSKLLRGLQLPTNLLHWWRFQSGSKAYFGGLYGDKRSLGGEFSRERFNLLTISVSRFLL